jgi:hypothetical protein
MKEISLHILDIVQNAIHAEAGLVEIAIVEDYAKNLFKLDVNDNGKGMSKEVLEKVNDPFFTTGNKKTGLGIPLLKQHCETCGGECLIYSEVNKGTHVSASFLYDHIDRQPLGDITATLISLIRSNPRIDFIYSHTCNGKNYTFKTREVKEELQDTDINNNSVIRFIAEMIAENIHEIVN